MFVSGYPTYPSSRGRVYCFYCIIAHRLAMFLLRPKRLRFMLPTLDILIAMPIKLVTRADPRKLILNQTFTLNGYMWKKNPCTLPRRRRNKHSVFFLLLNSSSSGEPESVLEGQGEGGGGGGGGITPRITEMVRSFFGCSLYILHMMYNQISLVTFNLILMTFQSKTCQIWYKLV